MEDGKASSMNSNRRTFALSAAAAALPHAYALQTANQKPLRAGFIGTGVRGGNLLKQTIAQPQITVAAICDTDPAALDRSLTAAAASKPKSVPEWRALLDLKDIDAVFIATPCDLHAEMAAAALEAGKYVYCEKPLGITPEQVDRVLRVARKSKTFLQIGQQLRYFPSVREAVRQIHQGIVGKSYIIKAHRHGSRSKPNPEESRRAPRPTWYNDVRRSGDLIVENAVHNIDACNWIANSRPVSAYGHGKKYFPKPIPPGTEMMDGFSVEYIYENDMHLDYSQISFHPRLLKTLPSGMWYTVFGEKGTVFMTHDSAEFYDIYGESQPVNMLPQGKPGPENAIQDFFACIREGRKPFADITVAATAALTVIMGREAMYKGRSVTWKELGVEV